MSDNDVRIASLVENIHRKGLNDEEKGDAIYKVYKAEGFKDIQTIARYLTFIHNHADELQKNGYFNLEISSRKKESKGRKRGEVPPDKFMDISKRISYNHDYQRQLLTILDEFKDTRVDKTFGKTDLLTANQKKLEMLKHPDLKTTPKILEMLAYLVRKLSYKNSARVFF
jgi:hypothetical protein